jgi:hypothetical protein
MLRDDEKVRKEKELASKERELAKKEKELAKRERERELTTAVAVAHVIVVEAKTGGGSAAASVVSDPGSPGSTSPSGKTGSLHLLIPNGTKIVKRFREGVRYEGIYDADNQTIVSCFGAGAFKSVSAFAKAAQKKHNGKETDINGWTCLSVIIDKEEKPIAEFRTNKPVERKKKKTTAAATEVEAEEEDEVDGLTTQLNNTSITSRLV